MRPLSSSLVLLLPALMACKQEAGESGTFASATQAQRQAAVISAAGLLPPLLVTSLLPASFDIIMSDGDCPSSTMSGSAVVLTADGCVGPSGITWDGEVRTVNVPNFMDLGGVDTGQKPMTVEANGWSADDLQFDGEFWQSALEPEDAWEARADLVVDVPGLATVSWKGELACQTTEDGGTTCPAVRTPTGIVDELEPFTIEGLLGMSAEGVPTGRLELVGDDVLAIDFDTMDAETGCVPAELDGEAIEDICLDGLDLGGEWEPTDPGETSDVVFTGTGIGSDGEQILLDATTEGEAFGVEAVIRIEGRDGEEVHPLVAAEDADPDSQFWVASLVDGPYLPGSQTALELVATGAADSAVMFQALDGDGDVAACSFVGFTSGDPADLFDTSDCPADGGWSR